MTETQRRLEFYGLRLAREARMAIAEGSRREARRQLSIIAQVAIIGVAIVWRLH